MTRERLPTWTLTAWGAAIAVDAVVAVVVIASAGDCTSSGSGGAGLLVLLWVLGPVAAVLGAAAHDRREDARWVSGVSTAAIATIVIAHVIVFAVAVGASTSCGFF